MSLLRAAETLKEATMTLDPAPLETAEQQEAFYRTGIQAARGVDRLGRMRMELADAIELARPHKAFLMGHPGVGKTTELWRLAEGFDSQLQTLYISVNSELNPGAFRYYDVLLLILIRLVEATSSPTVIGFEDHSLDQLKRRVFDCFTDKWQDYLQTRENTFEMGMDVLFAKAKWTLKQGRTFKKDEERFEASFVSDLVDLMNDLLDECNRLLQKHKSKQWLIIVDDFEKLGIEESPLQALFSGLRPSLQSLQANLIFVIPVWLHFSREAPAILPSNFIPYVLPDLPVFTRDKKIDQETVAAMLDLINSRMQSKLLDATVAERCIRASGGSLRDLFTILRQSALSARMREAASISVDDCAQAIQELRNAYKLRLGSTSASESAVTLEQKLERLKQIYLRENDKDEVPDAVLYDLLRQRFVLHYNGSAWMGIHSLAVDLLIQFDKLNPGSPGGSTI